MAVAAIIVALLPVRTAHACSCAPPELTGVLEVAGPTQALVVAERVDLDGGPDGTLRILETLAGGPVVGPVRARFDDGASCDPGMAGGTVAALVLERRDGAWATTTCGQVGIGEALLAVDEPPVAAPGAGPPTLLLGGAYGGATLAAVDARGRVRAYAGDDTRTAAVAVCPGANTVVSLASTDRATHLHRWTLPDLQPAGDPVVVTRGPTWQAGALCLDPDGDAVTLALPTDGASGAVVTVEGEEVDVVGHPIHAVDQAGGTLAVTLEDGTGQPSTMGIVEDDGRVRTLATRPGTVFDRIAVSPSGDHVLAAGYPPDHEGDQLVLAATDGSSFADRRIAGFVLIGWLGPDRAFVRSGDTRAFGAAVTSVEALDLELETVDTRDVGTGWEAVGLADGSVLTHGGVPPSVRRDGTMTRVDDVRLTGTDVAVPIDPNAVLTEAAPAPPASRPTPSPVAGPADAAARTSAVTALPYAASALALGALVVLVWRRRARGE